MAEIRKHNPELDDIAAAVRAAMGEDIRPVTPGEDPFDSEEPAGVTELTFNVSSQWIGQVPEEILFAGDDD